MAGLVDSFLTIAETGEAQYTESRSRFIAYAHHVDDELQVKGIVSEYRRRYYDARHICYAYALDPGGNRTRQNDDGEPSGTAGRPIAQQIRAAGVTDALVVVIRYFGGVKLGTNRLAVAYKTAAAEALIQAKKAERVITAQLCFSVPYADADAAMRCVRDNNASFVSHDYTATCNVITVAVRLSQEPQLRQRLSKIFTLHFIEQDDRHSQSSEQND